MRTAAVMVRMVFLTLCAGAVFSPALQAFQSQVPAGSGIQVIGVHPEPRNDPRPLVAHFPLANFLSLELDFATPSMALTFDQGIVTYYDEDGTAYRTDTFGVTVFDDHAVRLWSDPAGSGASIPMGERIVLYFPLENLGHNEMPSALDVALCFDEFAGPNGECDDPVMFADIKLYEYHVPEGETYIYPAQTPAGQGENWWSGGAYELGKPNGHRRGGFRRNDSNLTAWVNQRYAWDIFVTTGTDWFPDCDDGNGGSGDACNQLSHYFCWGEPIVAPAAGEIVLLTQGNPDNSEPRCVGRGDCSGCTTSNPPDPPLCDLAPGAATCNNEPTAGLCSATTDPCPPGGFPGSGNQVVLLHDNGEYSTFAHMKQGSNDHLACGQRVEREFKIGEMGMSGSGSNPHLHFSTLFTPGPEAQIAEGPPMYFNNVQFLTPGATVLRRQLDVGIPTSTLLTAILDAPAPIPQNKAQKQTEVNEQEPNDTLGQHTALNYPTTVTASLEMGEVGDLAVRGDGIEDIFRIDPSGPDSLRVDLTWDKTGQNLDLYALDEEWRVMNDTWQGTRPLGETEEAVCLEVDAGAYYLLVTNTEITPSEDTPYSLSVASEAQTISVTMDDAGPISVDGTCQATVGFTIDLHDNCCLDPANLNLQVTASNPDGNATLGQVMLDMPQVQSKTDVTVTGSVGVSGLTGCPAVVRIEASAEDCSGNVVDTADSNSGDAVELIDDMPPTVMSSVNEPRLWGPEHSMQEVGFMRSATDNCDGGIGNSLGTVVFADEPEIAPTGDGAGKFAPDAMDPDGSLKLRSERRGGEDGRLYLITTRATDACGNESFSCSAVGVPHDESAESQALMDAQEAAAIQFCENNDGDAPGGFHRHGDAAVMNGQY